MAIHAGRKAFSPVAARRPLLPSPSIICALSVNIQNIFHPAGRQRTVLCTLQAAADMPEILPDRRLPPAIDILDKQSDKTLYRPEK
jgi:hypothetical protein